MLNEIVVRDLKHKLIKKDFVSPYGRAEMEFRIFKWLDNFSETDLINYIGVDYKIEKELLRFIVADLIYVQFMGDPNFREFVFERA